MQTNQDRRLNRKPIFILMFLPKPNRLYESNDTIDFQQISEERMGEDTIMRLGEKYSCNPPAEWNLLRDTKIIRFQKLHNLMCTSTNGMYMTE